MRLRSLMLAVSALGAVGAILLAADMYRRLWLAEAAAPQNSPPGTSGAMLVFGAAHVIGVAALAVLFLALCLILLPESQKQSSSATDIEVDSSPVKNAADLTPTLVLFTRFPEPGRAKTRLIPALGADGAARLAAAMLLDFVDSFCAAPDNGLTGILCFDPGTDAAATEWKLRELLGDVPGAFNRFEFLAQQGGGLGERLSHALQTVQAHRPGPCVFIGSDALLNGAQIERALNATRSGNASLLPAADGGYVLLAVPANASPSVFENIAWSCSETANHQVAQLDRCGVNTEVLTPQFFDVDEPQDLTRLKEFLAQENEESWRRTRKLELTPQREA